MNRIAPSLVGLVLLSGSVIAADPPPAFVGGPPIMGEAQFVGEILVISLGLPKIVQQTREGTRTVGGVEETFTYEVPMTVTMPHEEAVALGDYRILDMQGKPVADKVLAERLKKLTPVLFVMDGRRLDPKYLVLYKPDTLIVYLHEPTRTTCSCNCRTCSAAGTGSEPAA